MILDTMKHGIRARDGKHQFRVVPTCHKRTGSTHHCFLYLVISLWAYCNLGNYNSEFVHGGNFLLAKISLFPLPTNFVTVRNFVLDTASMVHFPEEPYERSCSTCAYCLCEVIIGKQKTGCSQQLLRSQF